MRSPWTLLFLLSLSLAQASKPQASFTENKGQWPVDVLYRVLLPNGALFVEREAFTYVLQSGGLDNDHGTAGHVHGAVPHHAHAFRARFVDGRAHGHVGQAEQQHYENFFLGSDTSRWGTGCSVFGEVVLKDVWPGIDLRLDGRVGLKYELIVAPGADPSMVRFQYEGHDRLILKDGALAVGTSAGELVEEAPFTFQWNGTAQDPVGSRYRLQGDLVTFDLPDGYDVTRPLVIDPTLAFASYSGSTGNNFGFTATYDSGGHLYGGGIVFNVGYPTTLGVLDDSFNGGTIDVGITKWSVDGSSLVWSTYYGGTGNESPHSMVVNADDELYVFGSTGSFDLPTTLGCLDNSFAGGPPLTFTIGYGFDQPNGTDMFVAHFNATATSLIGSTYIGGGGNDGINNDPVVTHNYGDSFRGEIIVNAGGDPVVASTTASAGLPIAGGGPQPAYGGGSQDGYCFRLDPTLSVVLWSTYVGGSGTDAAYGVQVDSNDEIFVTGGTTSADLPMVGMPLQPGLSGGTDGFIMRYTTTGVLVGSTFIGTPSYDQCYFVQLNTADEVFVVGQTHGNYPVTPGKYTVAGSSQFIHKVSHTLGTSLWSTRFGNGDGTQDLSPTAFLVSDCGQIYFSGWGGVVNGNAGNTTSTTTGLEVTADAFQSTTDGNDLYLMLLEPEATALNYATYFGGNLSAEHVDGGTSRFDKNGTVYQAVCAGCQSNSDFPTTPGAWSNTNNSFGCNLGVLKFDLAQGQALIQIDGPSTLCIPATAEFINNSTGGNTYLWDFGNGDSSNEEEPTVVYDEPGTYTVTMILSDNTDCIAPDTASIQVEVLPSPVAAIEPIGPICLGASVQLQASGGDTYTWFPEDDLSDISVPDPILTPSGAGIWSVVVSSLCGSDTASITIEPGDPSGSAGDDVEICLGQSTVLSASGGGTYTWTPDGTLNDPVSATPIATPTDTTTYTVVITTPEGCVATDSVVVLVISGTPEPSLGDTVICQGSSIRLTAPEGDSYAWESANGISETDIRDPVVAPTSSTRYVVHVSNVCGTVTDSAFVDVIEPLAEAWPDTVVCPGQVVPLFASDGSSFAWSPPQGLDDASLQAPTALVNAPTMYTVTITDAFGCIASASLMLGTHPPTPVDAGPDRVVELGRSTQLSATGEGSFSWTPAETLDHDDIATPVASPLESTTYTVTLTDANGCTAKDAVTIIIPGSLYVPNTFTPNGDGTNDAFGAWGKDIKTIELMVFNRWGELIWSTEQLGGRWDGTYKGVESPIDTYVWKVKATEVSGNVQEMVGHVNLLR